MSSIAVFSIIKKKKVEVAAIGIALLVCYNKSMKEKKAIWVWVGGAIILVALAGCGAWYFYGNKGPAALVVAHAPAGQLIAGFPKELVAVDPSAQLTSSYTVAYSSKTNQYSAEWTSSSSAAALYDAYQSYAKANQWTISNFADYPFMKALYLTNVSGAKANIELSAVGTGAKVTISYVVP